MKENGKHDSDMVEDQDRHAYNAQARSLRKRSLDNKKRGTDSNKHDRFDAKVTFPKCNVTMPWNSPTNQNTNRSYSTSDRWGHSYIKTEYSSCLIRGAREHGNASLAPGDMRDKNFTKAYAFDGKCGLSRAHAFQNKQYCR